MKRYKGRRGYMEGALYLASVALIVCTACAAADFVTAPPEQSEPVIVEQQLVVEPKVLEPVKIEEPLPSEEPEPQQPEIVSLGEFKLTHYCPCPKCCGQWSDGITYTGTTATEGRTIAVDPKVIPLGSTVVIGGQEYIAEDVGGSIKGNRIDVFMESHEAALIEGVKYAEVFVYV